jgi:predicted nucleotidyltransferase
VLGLDALIGHIDDTHCLRHWLEHWPKWKAVVEMQTCGDTAFWGALAGHGRTIEAMAKNEKSFRSIAISEVREDIRRIATAHGAGNVRVFGSAGRGEQSASSDLDLLVDMAEGRTLFDLIALSNDLEDSLGVEVDVVTEASVSPYMRDHVLGEAVAL